MQDLKFVMVLENGLKINRNIPGTKEKELRGMNILRFTDSKFECDKLKWFEWNKLKQDLETIAALKYSIIGSMLIINGDDAMTENLKVSNDTYALTIKKGTIQIDRVELKVFKQKSA